MRARSAVGGLAVMMTFLASATFTERSEGATIASIDQQNLVFETQSNTSLNRGQSFTATYSGIDAIEFDLSLQDHPSVDPRTFDFSVNIRDGVAGADGLQGAILGSSEVIAIADTAPLQTYHFDFATLVPLTPGTTYVAEIATTINDGFSFAVRVSTLDPYSGGRYFIKGFDVDHPGNFGVYDAVFTSGLHTTPEPSGVLLMSLGLAGWVLGSRRRVAGRGAGRKD